VRHLHNVEDDTNRPVVYFFVVSLAFDDLWRDVIGSAARSRGKFALNKTRQTEVSNFDGRVGVRRLIQEILGLQVTVDDAERGSSGWRRQLDG